MKVICAHYVHSSMCFTKGQLYIMISPRCNEIKFSNKFVCLNSIIYFAVFLKLLKDIDIHRCVINLIEFLSKHLFYSMHHHPTLFPNYFCQTAITSTHIEMLIATNSGFIKYIIIYCSITFKFIYNPTETNITNLYSITYWLSK